MIKIEGKKRGKTMVLQEKEKAAIKMAGMMIMAHG